MKRRFPAGKYYIGDIMGCMTVENWDALIDYWGRPLKPHAEKSTIILPVCNEKTYCMDDKGNRFKTESKTIGIIDYNLIDHYDSEYGFLQLFDEDFYVDIGENGIVKIHDHIININ